MVSRFYSPTEFPPLVRSAKQSLPFKPTQMMHDEPIGIECHGISWAALSDRDTVQQLDGRRIKAEEV